MSLTRAGLLLLVIASSLVAAEPAVRVTCPAISYDDHNDRNRNGPDGANPVVLMVKARTVTPAANRVKGKRQPDDDYRAIEQVDLEIEQVLFGPSPGKTIRVDSSYISAKFLEEPQSRIFSLSINRDGKYSLDTYYAVDRTMELADEKAAIALARARLDYHVLGSASVFIGSPVAADKVKNPKQNLFGLRDESYSKVRVERVLAGSLKPGEEIDVDPADALPELKSQRGPFLYLISEKDSRPHDAKLSVYRERTHWPLSMLDAVQAALARRADYPTEDVTDDYGEKHPRQEILFLGPRADVIEMTGLENEAARFLASRRLMHDGKAAIPDMVAAIEKHLWSDTSEPEQSFRMQKFLIDGLGVLEDHRADGEVVRLIGPLLTKAEQGATFPTRREVDEQSQRFRQYDELAEDSNHSLAWLLLTLPEVDAAKLFGLRLLKLRDLAAYGWKDEAQFVLDASHIEDHLACAPLLAEAGGRQPLRWSAGVDGNDLGNYQMSFSPDGKFLAAAGSQARVWSTSNWETVARLDHSGSVNAVCFSPNGNDLYIGGGGGIPVVTRWDWRERRLEMRYQGLNGAAQGMQIAPDADFLWTSDREQTIIYLSTTGVAQLKLSDRDWQQIRFAPTGKRCLVNRGRVWHLSTTPNLPMLEKLTFPPLDVAWAGPDQYWSLEENEAAPTLPPEAPRPDENPFGTSMKPARPSILRLRSAASQEQVREIPLTIAAKQLFASRDAQMLVALNKRQAEVVLLPANKPSGKWDLPQTARDSRDQVYALSPDGRLLAVGGGHEYPRLIDVATGKQLPLGKGHVDRIASLNYSADGQELISIDERGGECRWKSDSGQMVERKSLEAVKPAAEDHKPYLLDEQGQFWLLEDERPHPYYPPSAFEVRVGKKLPSVDDVGTEKKFGKLIGQIEPRWGQYEPYNLVPGGKYLHVGTHIYARSDLKLVSAQNVSGSISSVAFNSDGSRYALLTEEADFRPSPLGMGIRERHVTAQTLRVHDTMTGRPLFCQPVGQETQLIALSPDGRKVASVNKRQEIEVWPVGK